MSYTTYPFAVHRVKFEELHDTSQHCDDEDRQRCATVAIAEDVLAIIIEKDAQIKRLQELLK